MKHWCNTTFKVQNTHATPPCKYTKQTSASNWSR